MPDYMAGTDGSVDGAWVSPLPEISSDVFDLGEGGSVRHKVGHEWIVSEILFECFVDLRYHVGVGCDELVKRGFPEGDLGGSVG